MTLALLAAGLPYGGGDGWRGPRPVRLLPPADKNGTCKGDAMPADLQCGQVTIPLDYARPGAGTLDLALARYRATVPSRYRTAELRRPRRPGSPAARHRRQGLHAAHQRLRRGDLRPARCRPVLSVSCGSSIGQGSDATGAATHDSSPAALLKQVRKDADACAKHSSPVLAHIGTSGDAARDLDVMRQALGDKKLNYLGFSYGTRLGAVYASQFPTDGRAWCSTAWTRSPSRCPSSAW